MLVVYVIGDIVCGLALVYKVIEEGVMVVEIIVGYMMVINYDCIFFVVYIYLEVVWVGIMEE